MTWLQRERRGGKGPKVQSQNGLAGFPPSHQSPAKLCRCVCVHVCVRVRESEKRAHVQDREREKGKERERESARARQGTGG